MTNTKSLEEFAISIQKSLNFNLYLTFLDNTNFASSFTDIVFDTN